METEVLKEIKEIRLLLSKLIGTQDLPKKERFSIEAIDNAAKELQGMAIKRGEWVEESDISKVIKKAPWGAGKFIIEHFQFTNYFKRGRSLYFNKKDMVALAQELKDRNVNLNRYMELLKDKEKFRLKVEEAASQTGKKKTPHFHIPNDLRDVETKPYTPPSRELIEKDIAELKADFEKHKYAEYIDVYHDNHAMFKFEYYFDKYLDADLKRRCKKWCNDFNYAHAALEKIKRIRSYEVY